MSKFSTSVKCLKSVQRCLRKLKICLISCVGALWGIELLLFSVGSQVTWTRWRLPISLYINRLAVSLSALAPLELLRVFSCWPSKQAIMVLFRFKLRLVALYYLRKCWSVFFPTNTWHLRAREQRHLCLAGKCRAATSTANQKLRPMLTFPRQEPA